MLITLTDAQFDELRVLVDAISAAKTITNTSSGEVVSGTTKVEWETNEVKFTVTD